MQFRSIGYVSVLFMLFTCSSAYAEWSANVGFTTNYLWRGITQTDNKVAVQGSLDYGHESGFYAGAWTSNVDFGAADPTSVEVDVYLGYAGETDAFEYDFLYNYYIYTDAANSDLDYGELIGSLTFGQFQVGANYIVNGNDDEVDDYLYLHGNLSFDILNDASLTFHLGYSTGDTVDYWYGEGDDYTDYGVSLSKGDFTMGLTNTSLDQADDVKVYLSYSYSLDL